MPNSADPRRAGPKIIRVIFEAAESGTSTTEIAAQLRRDQVPAPGGGYWSKSVVRQILRDERRRRRSNWKDLTPREQRLTRAVRRAAGSPDPSSEPESHTEADEVG